MCGNYLQKDFLCCPPRDQGKVHGPVVPQILLRSVIEQKSDLYILPGFRDLPKSTQTLKIISEWSVDDMNQLLSSGRCNPSGAMNFG